MVVLSIFWVAVKIVICPSKKCLVDELIVFRWVVQPPSRKPSRIPSKLDESLPRLPRLPPPATYPVVIQILNRNAGDMLYAGSGPIGDCLKVGEAAKL